MFVVFNTFFGLLTQEDQISCFRSVAQRITPDGRFLLEVFVPNTEQFRGGQNVSASVVEVASVTLNATRHDRNAQVVSSQSIQLRGSPPDVGGSTAGDAPGAPGPTSVHGHLFPVVLRYAYPSELDLMARLAGLRLIDRWEDWQRSPFTNASTRHISVYGPADSA